MYIMLKIFYVYGPQNSFLEILWSAKNVFPWFLVPNLKSLGITDLVLDYLNFWI
jgi:hypothetical protein